MVVFLLKSSACLAIFLMFYKLLLEKERMHTFKRYYLLAALAFALVIPSITYVQYIEVTPAPVSYEITEAISMETSTAPLPIDEPSPINWPSVLWGIYLLGVLFFSLRFLKNLLEIARNIRNNPKLRIDKLINVLLQSATVPHTFFNYIFLERKKFEANAIPKEVLVHEATHARQKHSLDILFVELLQIIFWFNPLIFFTKNAMKLNHEFLADRAVLNNGTPTSVYQNTLLSFASSADYKDYQSTMANAINYSSYSSIKKRFTAMKTRTSKKSVLFRSILLMPLLAILFYSFTETEIIYRTESTTKGIDTEQNLNTDSATERSVELAGLILDSETLKPLENVEIYDSDGDVLTKTDDRGYYKVQFDELGQGEIRFEFSLRKNGYKTLSQREHWGNLKGKKASTNYYGLQKKESNTPEFSQHIPNNRNLSYGSVLNSFHLVKSRFEFNKKIENAKKDNQHILFEIDNAYYLVNDTGLIKINSKDDLISINDDRIVRASEVNNLIERKEITGMTPLDIKSAQYAIYTIPVDHIVRPQKGATKEQLSKYNTLAKKYNAQPKEKRIIPSGDLQNLELIYRKMSEEQKVDAQPFPECPSDKSPQQTERKIEVRISNQGQLLVDDQLMDMKNFKQYLLKTNTDLSKKERQNAVRAIIIAPPGAPKKIVEEVEKLITDHGTATIDIHNEDHLIIPGKPTGATGNQMDEYNTMAKEYNTMLAEGGNFRIKKTDVDRLEYLHGIMTDEQRANAEPFPDFPEPPEPPVPPILPSSPDLSEKEFADEVIEYIIANQDPSDGFPHVRLYSHLREESFIDKYTKQPKQRTYFSIEDEDVTIYLDGKKISHLEMMQMQKDGEIESINVLKSASGQNVISITSLNEQTNKASVRNPQHTNSVLNYRYRLEERYPLENEVAIPPSVPAPVEMEEKEIEQLERYSHFPAPPNLAYRVDQKPLTKELKKLVDNFSRKKRLYQNAAKDYLNNDRGNENEIYAMYENLMAAYDEYKVMAKDEGIFAYPAPAVTSIEQKQKNALQTPPAPPKPKAPLDYLIEMAKKDARFYYKGKEITGDKAIELMKKNNSLNIDSNSEKGKRPVVKLSKEGVKVGDASGIQDSRYNLQATESPQKVELVSMHSYVQKEQIEVGKRIIEFQEKFKNCFSTKFYYKDNLISTDEALRIFIENKDVEIAADDSKKMGLWIDCENHLKKS